jgi:hypothetical protein
MKGKMRILGNASELREEYAGSFKWNGLSISKKLVEAPRPICVVPFDHPGYRSDMALTVSRAEDMIRSKIDCTSRSDVVVKRSTWLAFGE